MVCSIHDFTFYDRQKFKDKSLLSLQKKKLACAMCYVACVINHPGKLICLHACLHECDGTGLIDKPDWMDQPIFFCLFL